MINGRTIALAAGLSGWLVAATPATAQRAETTTPAIVFESPKCLLTPDGVLAGEREATSEFFGPLVASLFAGFAGKLVESGVNALGDALDAASREQGFVAEGSAAIRFGMIDPGASVEQQAAFRPTERCISLYVPSGSGDIADILSDTTLTRNGTLRFDWTGDEVAQLAIINDLRRKGVTDMPRLYAEAVILPGKEGFVFRPTLVWYESALPGAPKGSTAAEMHVLFATPGYEAGTPGIGEGFAGARLALPRLAPESVLDWNQLAGSRSVWLPLRPTEGVIDTAVQAHNAAKTAVATRTAELAKAERALAAAKRLQLRDPGPEADEAAIVADEARQEADAALKAARLSLGDGLSEPAGATNMQLRIVVIRDANRFGQAIAKALKSQAEAAGKGVTERLTPQADWEEEDTAYLTAMITVEQKQKAYDDAVAAGEAAAITAAGDELRLAKAKANEAAVAARKIRVAG